MRLDLPRLLLIAFAPALLPLPVSHAADTAAPALAAAIDVAETTVSVRADHTAVAPGAKFRLGLTIKHAPHKHTYWSNPGDTGTPTTLTWNNAAGVTFGPLRFPAPKFMQAEGILAFVHEGETTLILEGTVPASAKPGDTLKLDGTLSWLECDDSSCLPGEAPVAISLPVAEKSVAAPDALSAAESRLPLVPPVVAALVAGDATTGPAIVLPAAALAGRNLADARFFPDSKGLPEGDTSANALALAKPEKLADGSVKILHPKAGTVFKFTRLDGVLAFADGRSVAVTASGESAPKATAPVTPVTPTKPTPPPSASGTPAVPDEEKTSFGVALLLALLGGLVLNIMPCVFPVLGLKIYGFVNKSGGDPRAALRHGLAFALGIIVSFWALAGALIAVRGVAAGLLGASQNELGWGFLQQMPGFNVLIAVLFLVMALGMAGVFEFGTGVQNAAGSVQEREGYFGSFLSGALATLVATPCSGPGMAPAISFALAAPAIESFAVFTALAVGLALPFVVLSASPKLLALLPRPGAWMESFKQGMSFLLFGSFAYFLWMLAGQLEEQPFLFTLFAFTVLAAGVWVYGRWTTPEKTDTVRLRAKIIAAALTLGSLAFIFTQLPKSRAAVESQVATDAASREIVWSAWSPEAQAAALADGKTVYIDFTARWCLTCQANKYVYHDAAVMNAFAQNKVVALKADWTNRSKLIATELAKYDKQSIPFNVVLRKDAKPVALPAVLTPGIVAEAAAAK